MIKKNNYLQGAIIGIFLPAIIYGIGFLIGLMLGINVTTLTAETSKYFNNANLMLVSIFANMIPFRYYMVKLKFEKTGKTILVVTLLYTVVFFYFYL